MIRCVTLIFLLIASPAFADQPAGANWAEYLGDKSRTHFSTLRQINKSNVATLVKAWEFDTGERGEYQANNLIINGVLYTPTKSRKLIALNAATGEPIWTWNPANERSKAGRARQRGLVFWQNDQGDEQRLFSGVNN